MKQYKVTTRGVPARPRNGEPTAVGGGGGSVRITINEGGGAGTDHQHANKELLDRLSAWADRTLLLNEGGVNGKIKAGHADTAGEATHAASSHDLDAASPVWGKVLSKIHDDVAAGRITFERGAAFGQWVQGLSGASVDGGGNAEVESLTVRSAMTVLELIYNRINAVEGDFTFADSGTIDRVADDDGGVVLVMRQRWDGDTVPFQSGDIVYGYVNDLDSATPTYSKAWGIVEGKDGQRLVVAPYDSDDVPGGRNGEFAPGMVIARWGNVLEATAANHAMHPAVVGVDGDGRYYNKRQTTFFISADEGNLVELMGVDAPTLRAANYGAVLGKLPDGLVEGVGQLINRHQPYLYARGLVVQDLIRIGYPAIQEQRYRGEWEAQPTEAYRSTDKYYDTVTHGGSLWRCVEDETDDEPGVGGGWAVMVAKGADGAAGQIAYMAGMYDSSVTYDSTGNSTPVVMDGREYYMLLPGVTYRGADRIHIIYHNTPSADVANGGWYWQHVDRFSVVFADVVMADFAKLASAVFWGDWMISQQGRQEVVSPNGATTMTSGATSYQNFPDNGFTPNIQMNFRTGEARFGNIEFSGGTMRIWGDNAVNIVIGKTADGMAVLQFLDNDGNVLYDLGPAGIRSVVDAPEAWSDVWLKRLTASTTMTEAMVVAQYGNNAKLVPYSTDNHKHQFHSASTGGVVNYPDDDGRVFNSTVRTEGNKLNGWYCRASSAGVFSGYPAMSMVGEQAASGRMTDIYKYVNGALVSTVRLTWTI